MTKYIELTYDDEFNLAKKIKHRNVRVDFDDRVQYNGKFWGLQRCASWNVEDYETMQKYHRDINLLNWLGDTDAAFRRAAEFNIYIRKIYNDHHQPFTLYPQFKMEAIDAALGHNKITSSGIVGIVLILGMQSSEYFLWVSMGYNPTPERIGQKNLIQEEIRVSVQKDGSMSARGSVLNHVGNMGYGVRSDTYYEFGIHNKAEGGRMFSRSVLSNGLEQEQNNTFLTPSHSTIFDPV